MITVDEEDGEAVEEEGLGRGFSLYGTIDLNVEAGDS